MKCMCTECGYPNAKLSASGIECPEPTCPNYSGKFSQYVDAVTTEQTPTAKPKGCGEGICGSCDTTSPSQPWAGHAAASNDDDDDDEDEEEDYYDDYGDDYDDDSEDWDDRDSRNLDHIKFVFLKKIPRKNTVELQFCLAGEPGAADKRIEFLFYNRADPQYKRTATLSNKRVSYVDYVEADGRSVYKTHWKCKEDGFGPLQAKELILEARVF